MPRKTVTIDYGKELERLREARNKYKDAADQVMAKILGEKREQMTPEEAEEIRSNQEKMVKIREQIDAIRATLDEDDEDDGEREGDEGEEDENDGERSRRGRRGEPRSRSRNQTGDDGTGKRTRPGEQSQEQRDYAEAFGRYLRYGHNSLDESDRRHLRSGYRQMETRAPQASGTPAAGGYLIPEGFIPVLEIAMKSYSGVLQAPHTSINTTSGNPLPMPTTNDTGNIGAQIGENTTVGEQEVAFGTVDFNAFIYTSRMVTFPIPLLEDSGVSIEGLLNGILAERLGRIFNQRLTTGTGSGQPQGVVTASTLGKTAAAVAAITHDEIIDLEHSVDPAYRNRPSAGFMAHDLTFAAVRKIKDSDGRPIWMPAMTAGLAGGAPGLISDKPYWINQDMAQLGAGNKTMLFGDFSKYAVRKVRDIVIRRLDERYAENLQVAFFAWTRMDGRLIDAGTNPIKHLVQAAS